MLVQYNKFKSLDNLKKMVNFYLVFSYILNFVYLSILNGLVYYILESTYLLVLYLRSIGIVLYLLILSFIYFGILVYFGILYLL